MSKEYVKVDDHTLEEKETKVVCVKFDLKTLRARKQVIESELDKINDLIDQAVALGVIEKPGV